MHACCSVESGAIAARSHAGTAWAERRSSMVAMSKAGSRCTVLSPASASSRRWRIPAVSSWVKAR